MVTKDPGHLPRVAPLLKQTVELPFDDDLYAEKIAELARTSHFQKVVRLQEDTDVNASFAK